MYASGSASGLKTCDFAMAGMSRQNSVVAASGMGSPPDFVRHLDHQPQFRGLLAHLDVVAVIAAREAALWRQRELFQWHVLRGFLDAPLDVIPGLERAELGRDQTQHHDLALRQEAQGTEVARTLVVVLQE